MTTREIAFRAVIRHQHGSTHRVAKEHYQMIYRKLRTAMLGLAPMVLLCACSSSDKAAPAAAASVQTAANPRTSEASAEVAAPIAASPAAAGGPTGSAVRGFIDPVTGQIRAPTPAELRALETQKQTLAPNSAISAKPGSKETVLPNGWVAVEVNSTSEMKGCVQKDGRVVPAHDCKSEPSSAVKKP
jgi:hypothetical protein